MISLSTFEPQLAQKQNTTNIEMTNSLDSQTYSAGKTNNSDTFPNT